MKPLFPLLIAFLFTQYAAAQTVGELVGQAQQLEKEMKETAALDKYKVILKLQPVNLTALCRASVLSAREGDRQASKAAKLAYYKLARNYAEAALQQDPNDAEANYAMAVVLGRMALIAGAKEKVAASRDVKKYADLAVKINPNFAHAYHLLGKWNYEVDHLNPVEKTIANMLFGGLPQASINDAIANYEKCRSLDPGFILNYYDLAKAYKANGEVQKAIEALKKAIALPVKMQDDPKIKENCKKLLAEWE